MERSEWAHLLWFNNINGIKPCHLDMIRQQQGSFERAFKTSTLEWLKRGWKPELAERLGRGDDASRPWKLMEAVEDAGISLICREDHDYPHYLGNIVNCPYVLYCKGRRELLADPCIAIVGARQCSCYGRDVAEQLASGLSAAGITVVSGMARGIDAAAHMGALEGPGSTIAVLGGGLDLVYPAENRRLYHRIAEQGLLISDYPPGTRHYASHFPARNRIISGLSRAVLVVEARIRSGSLITADMALEQGREVLAVPGPITSISSAGANNLIKQGARLVSCVEDILEETGLQPLSNDARQNRKAVAGQESPGPYPGDFAKIQVDPEQEKILKWLEDGPKNMNDLMALSGWAIGVLATALLKLEINGLVKSKPGNYYIMSTSH